MIGSLSVLIVADVLNVLCLPFPITRPGIGDLGGRVRSACSAWKVAIIVLNALAIILL